jgi:hypothetical protein
VRPGLSCHPVSPPRGSVRSASFARTVDSCSAGTRSVAGGLCESPTTPRSSCDAPRPGGEACVVRPGWSRSLRGAARGRPAVPRPLPARSPRSAVCPATTFRPLATARRPSLGEAFRAPVRLRHDRPPLLLSGDLVFPPRGRLWPHGYLQTVMHADAWVNARASADETGRG